VPELVPLVRVFGHIGNILGAQHPFDDNLARFAFTRALNIHYEWMFAKSMWGYRLESQGAILDRVAELAAAGTIDPAVTRREVFSVKALREGHEIQESGKSFGKIAFEVPETIE
jgi:NADPH:quinone reductase